MTPCLNEPVRTLEQAGLDLADSQFKQGNPEEARRIIQRVRALKEQKA